MAVEFTFRALFAPTKPRSWGSPARGVCGLSDRPDGVQWSAWYDLRQAVAVLAANLEGMDDEDGGWPLGRLVRRELEEGSQLVSLASRVPDERDVTVIWKRDVWSARYKVIGKDEPFLRTPARRLDESSWRRALEEAKAYLGQGYARRVIIPVALRKGTTKELEASPHLQFATEIWSSMPAGHSARLERMQRGRDLLMPFYEFIRLRSAP